jgi:choline dehydrogenase-like flavoprotein
VLEQVKISAGRDGLEELFPLYTDTPGQLRMSRQATAVWRKLERHAELLEQRGIRFGRARVAVQTKPAEGAAGCIHCGYCMYGCPYGYIFNAAAVVAGWQRHPLFTYQSDVVVESVHEQSDRVLIRGHRRGTNDRFEARVKRVYLAAGVIPTTGILLRSLGLWEEKATIKDSQYFLLPALLPRRISGVRQEALHALSQIFVELLDDQISRNTVHLQLYTHNDLIGRAVRNMFGPLQRPFDFLAREMEGRLILLQGFLHSNESSQIDVMLKRASGGDQLELKPNLNPHTRKVVGKVVRKLFRNFNLLGAVPLPMMLQFATPGRSFHAGGSFPMRVNPGKFETDPLGRPASLKRVHAVDATIFPSIPATTITFSAMANAHRIATETPVE